MTYEKQELNMSDLFNEDFLKLNSLVNQIFSKMDLFTIPGKFFDIYSEKGEQIAMIELNNSKLDPFHKNYFKDSEKEVKIYNQKYIGLISKFETRYEKLFNEKIKIFHKFKPS